MTQSYQELTKISREFKDLSSDLLRSTTNTFDSSLNFFKAFCDENEVIQSILQPIIESDVDSQAWYDNACRNSSSFVGSGNGTLPNRKADALKVIYDLLWDENAGNMLLTLGHNTMFTKNYNDQLRKVNDSYTILLVRFIIRELEDRIEMIKPQSNQAMVQTFNIHAPTNVATHSTEFTQNVFADNHKLGEILEQLRLSIDSTSEIKQQDKQDALETVEMIETELNKTEPSKSKIEKLVTLLPSVESISGIASNLISLF